MATLVLSAAQTTSTPGVSEGAGLQVTSTRDGAMFVNSWYEKQALRGRVVAANMGSITTPLTFLVTAANRPDA